jgi:ESS family glutamate:Na+ symporter
VNRRAVEGLAGLSIDGIVICAIGTLSLSALGDNVGPLVILAVASVAWSIVLVLVISRRLFERDWFEHSIAEFGEGQGTVATGFMMVDMVDLRARPASFEAIATGNCSPAPSSVVGSSRRFQSLSLLRWVFRSSRPSPWS